MLKNLDKTVDIKKKFWNKYEDSKLANKEEKALILFDNFHFKKILENRNIKEKYFGQYSTDI